MTAEAFPRAGELLHGAVVIEWPAPSPVHDWPATLDGRQVRFPIYEPEANPYRYDTEVTGMTDVRTELEKLQRNQAIQQERIDALLAAAQSGDEDVPGAVEDSVGPPEL